MNFDISEIADLYDRFANAEDPCTEDAREAEDGFYSKLRELHETANSIQAIDYHLFRRAVVSKCKAAISKKANEPPK
jgi:hypothetical protein